MHPLRPSVVVLALASTLFAQQPAGAGEREIAEKVQKLRDGIVEGRQIRSHVRVSVKLKNGNRLKGVVKDGRLVERVEGLRFVQAEANEDGAGIRIWYFDNSNNYVFLPFASIAEYRVQARLSTRQLQDLELQMVEDEQRRQELLQLQRAREQAGEPPAGESQPGGDGQRPPAGDGQQQPPSTSGAGTKPPAPAGEGQQEPTPKPPEPEDAKTEGDGKQEGETKQEGEAKLSDKQQEMFQLLQQYPPKAGWNAARRDEIKRRMAVLGSKPSAAELHFVEAFEQWQQAVTTFGAEPKESGAEPPAAETSRRQRRR